MKNYVNASSSSALLVLDLLAAVSAAQQNERQQPGYQTDCKQRPCNLKGRVSTYTHPLDALRDGIEMIVYGSRLRSRW